MKERQRYSGIYPIMWAFFDEMGKLDEKAMRLQVTTCIKTGAHGITILGLVTEMNKLSRDERQQIVEWVGNEISGRVPFAVTVPEPSIPGQIAFFSQTLNHTLTYGKYLTAKRLGLDNHRLRDPHMKPTEFGLRCVDRMTRHLGKFGEMCGPFAD